MEGSMHLRQKLAIAGCCLLATLSLSPALAMAAPDPAVVRSGDTIAKVAARLDTTPAQLLAANPAITNPDHIEVGAKLNRPAAGPVAAAPPKRSASITIEYVVQPGDALGAIAAGFGLSTKQLAKANNIANASKIRVGQKLAITVTNRSFTADLPARLRQRPQRLALMKLFDEAAAANNVPADLLKATCWLESGWQQDKISPAGAVGVCQVLPPTADYINRVTPGPDLDVHVAGDNIRLGAIYLRELLDRYDDTTQRALQAYNQGWGSLNAKGPSKTARNYATAITELRARFVIP
jgi:N-acetylmuramoyl-L-alanine amidase